MTKVILASIFLHVGTCLSVVVDKAREMMRRVGEKGFQTQIYIVDLRGRMKMKMKMTRER